MHICVRAAVWRGSLPTLSSRLLPPPRFKIYPFQKHAPCCSGSTSSLPSVSLVSHCPSILACNFLVGPKLITAWEGMSLDYLKAPAEALLAVAGVGGGGAPLRAASGVGSGLAALAAHCEGGGSVSDYFTEQV